MQHSCSHSNAICHHSVKKRIELRRQEQPLVAKHIGGTDWTRNDPNRNRRAHEVPFIAGCSHFTRKNTRFRAPASSPQHSPCNIHAAIPMRSANTDSRNAKNYTHRNNHSMQNTEEEPIELETIQTATAAHTRYLSSPAEAILRGKIQGFVLRLPPHNIAHATSMQPFQCDLPPQRQETHRLRIELRTQEQPLVAKPIGGTDWTRNDPNRNRRTHEVPFIGGCSHFTRKNTRFRAPASSPQHSPCNIHAAIPMRSAHTASRNA